MTHKVFGEGVVIRIQQEIVTIQFSEGTKKLGLRILFEKKLLEV